MKVFLKTKDYAVTGEEFQLLYDRETDMLITAPQPANLSRYYRSEDYISHTDSRRNFTEKLYHSIKKHNLKRKVFLMNQYAKGNKTLLDVGAGTGDFLSMARRDGWKVKGVEPNRMARGKASEKKIVLKKDLDGFSRKKFQIITLWHVLEHLPDLETQIEKITSLLEETGTLFLAAPNYKSYDAEHYQNFWAAYDVPRHLWHFSRTSIEIIFSRHKLEVVKIKPMIFDAFYVALLSEKYKTGRSHFIRAFYRGLQSNIKAYRTKDYSSLLYVLQKA